MRAPPAGLTEPAKTTTTESVVTERGGRIAVVVAASLFATGGTAIKHVDISALQVAGLRSAVAACVFFALSRYGPSSVATPIRTVRLSADFAWIAVAVAYAATMVMFVVAVKMTTAANTIFLQSTAPLYVLLAGPLLLGERALRRDVAYAAVLGVGMGLFFVGVEPALETAPRPSTGNWVAAASGMTWAATIMGLRRLRVTDQPVLPALFWGNVFALIVCIPWIVTMPVPALRDAGIVVYLGAFQVAAAYVALSRGVRGVSALEASLLLLLEPVCSAIFAAVSHREIPGVWAFAGCVVIVSATAGRAMFFASRDA